MTSTKKDAVVSRLNRPPADLKNRMGANAAFATTSTLIDE